MLNKMTSILRDHIKKLFKEAVQIFLNILGPFLLGAGTVISLYPLYIFSESSAICKSIKGLSSPTLMTIFSALAFLLYLSHSFISSYHEHSCLAHISKKSYKLILRFSSEASAIVTGMILPTFIYSAIKTPASEITTEMTLKAFEIYCFLFLLYYFLLWTPHYLSHRYEAPRWYKNTIKEITEFKTFTLIIWGAACVLYVYITTTIEFIPGFDYCK